MTATAAGFVGTAEVSVVPEGTVALGDFATPSQVYVVNLDGTERRFLVRSGMLYGGATTWDPDGRTIVFHYSSDGRTHLRRIPAAGGADAPLLSGTLPFIMQSTKCCASTRRGSGKSIFGI